MDPATTKLLLKISAKIIADEESRKRIVMLIVAPIIIFLLLISLILQILTSPIESLKLMLNSKETPVVDELRVDYGFTQALQSSDEGYQESLGQQYEGVTFQDGSQEVVYFNQLDKRWADMPYGPHSTIGVAGCGPTSLSIVVSTLTGNTVDPVTMSNWAYENGYLAEGVGSYHSLIPDGAKHFGLNVAGASNKEAHKVTDALTQGKLVIAIMGKGHFTTSGHFMVLRGVTSEGKILIADPASRKRSEQVWDFSIILNEARKNASAGGPFWIIG